MEIFLVGVFLVAAVLFVSGVGGAVSARWELKAFRAELEEAKSNEKELAQTLATILDGDGTVRGQLMLPGTVPTGEALEQLAQAQEELRAAQGSLRSAREEMRSAEEELKDLRAQTGVLAEMVDGNVVTQIRLPGEKVKPPNTTPCGALCKYGFWDEQGGSWRCRAHRGQSVDSARKQFLDAQGQCVMFKRGPLV